MRSALYHLGHNTLGNKSGMWSEGIETLPAVLMNSMQFATHMAVVFLFYSVHKLEIKVSLAGILWLHTRYNADDL